MESENPISIQEKQETQEKQEDPIVIPAEPHKRELTQDEKDSINTKFTEIFTDKLSNYISKYTNDINYMELMKYEFSDLFYELEKIKSEITEHFQNQKNLLSSRPSATARDADKVLLTSSNAKSSKNSDYLRSKTPTKLKSNKILEAKDSFNNNNNINGAAAAARNETARNYNTEKSKTPIKNLTKAKIILANNNSNNTTTIAENSKTIKEKTKPLNNNNNNAKLSDASKSTVKTEIGTKSSAAAKAANHNSNSNSRNGGAVAPKRDMTPTVRKTKQITNLDTSMISNLENSMLLQGESKGNQTNKNKNAKVSQFSSRNNNANNNEKKQDLNKTVVETSKNTLNASAAHKKGAAAAATSRKPIAKDSGAKPAVNGKPGKKDVKEQKATEEKHIVNPDENIDPDNKSRLKKENSFTNIMDIIAEKNKEVNMEEILSNEKKEEKTDSSYSNVDNNTNKIEKNTSEDKKNVIVENNNIKNKEEGKVNKPEENKNAEKKEEIPSIDEKPKEAENTKPVEIESKNIQSDKPASAAVPKNVPEYQNKRNKFLHQVIISQFLTPKENIAVILTNKELLNNKELFSYLKENYMTHLRNKISENNKIINSYIDDVETQAITQKQFALSKTALNGMNFIKKEDEAILSKKEQPESIPDLLRFFLLIISEEYENISNQKLIVDLFDKIYPKYKVDSLKSLIMYSIKNLNFPEGHFNKIIEYVNKRLHILNSNEYLPINRTLSYVTFCSKEIFEYLSIKLPDGKYANTVRSAFAQVNKSSEILSKLEKK